MAETARVTSKFQITIPKKVRQDARIQVGDFLIFVRTEDGWKIQKVPDDTVAALRLAGGVELRKSIEEHHEEFEKGWDDERQGDQSTSNHY